MSPAASEDPNKPASFCDSFQIPRQVSFNRNDLLIKHIVKPGLNCYFQNVKGVHLPILIIADGLCSDCGYKLSNLSFILFEASYLLASSIH